MTGKTNGCLSHAYAYIPTPPTPSMIRPILALVLVVTLLAGCAAPIGSPPATDPMPTEPNSTTPDDGASPDEPNSSSPDDGASPDEPPLDFDGADSTLTANEQPHVVRLTNDGNETKTVRLQVSRDGAVVFEQEFRSFPNTTVLGQLDHVGNYTLTVSVVDGNGTVTETIPASSFDCNHSTTTVDLSGSEPTAETVSTEIACGTADPKGSLLGGKHVLTVALDPFETDSYDVTERDTARLRPLSLQETSIVT